MVEDIIVNNMWTAWSPSSLEIPFESHDKGVGPGEYRVAAEFGCGPPKGQNSPYDLDIPGLGFVDVKKLDNGSFNTGVEGRDSLRPIKDKIGSFTITVRPLLENSYCSDDINRLLNRILETSPDELAEGTLNRFYELFLRLNRLRTELVSKTVDHSAFDPITGVAYQATAVEVYRMSLARGIPQDTLQMKLGADYSLAKIIEESLSHPYILDPHALRHELSGLVNMFVGYTLIFVDNQKGYYIMKNPETQVQFMRITRGNPRFKVKERLASS